MGEISLNPLGSDRALFTSEARHLDFNPSLLIATGDVAQSTVGLDLTGRIGQQGQNFGTLGLRAQQVIRNLFGFDPGFDRNGQPIPSIYGYGDSRSEPQANPDSQTGAAIIRDGRSYAYVQPDNAASEASLYGISPAEFGEANALEEVTQKLLLQALPATQHEVIGDTAVMLFDRRLTLQPFMELALQATGRLNLPARYQEVLNTSRAALDALAVQYGIQVRQDSTPGLVLTERYLSYLNRDGSWSLQEITFESMAEFARSELGVSNGQQFAQDFQNQFVRTFSAAAERILAPLRPQQSRPSS